MHDGAYSILAQKSLLASGFTSKLCGPLNECSSVSPCWSRLQVPAQPIGFTFDI